jgi:hypothetical protein
MATKRIQKYGTHGTLGAICAVVIIESLRDHEKKTGQLLKNDLADCHIFGGSICGPLCDSAKRRRGRVSAD